MAPVTTMHILISSYVIASFYSLKWLGTCSEVPKENTSHEDSFIFETAEKTSPAVSYLETTEISVPERLNHGSPEGFVSDFIEVEPVISDPLFEDGSWNLSGAKQLSTKRDIPVTGLSHENKMQILQLHNLYRSNVTPPAGNMAYMEWDVELERLAQIWADRCVFEHGMPNHGYKGTIGQNLYIGTDPTGYLGLYLWYEEYHHYNLRNEHCLPNQQCGHYVQMAWSESNKLGCAMTKCNMRYYVVCHYSPQAMRGVQMYRVAKPCSQCSSKNGGLCLKNLCMTQNQCKNNPFDCQFADCNLECHNCGRLNKEKCVCECTDGWDSPDCSQLCVDKHKRCGMSPGWPTKASCSMNNYAVAETYCRRMCDMCNPMLENSNDTCCNRKLCDEGFVLVTQQKSCKCTLLCPGPLCDGKDAGESQAALGSSAEHLRITWCVICWMIILGLNNKILWKCI